MSKIDPNLLKIGDAAELLGVTRRTIYRWIWSGELQASKVGGIYFIRREDLDALINKGRTKKQIVNHEISPYVVCGSCNREIENENQIAGNCRQDDCEELICKQCWSLIIRNCRHHSPEEVIKQDNAWNAYLDGDYKLVITRGNARLQEINFIRRVKNRIQSINTLIHPTSGQALVITDWDSYRVEGDDRVSIMKGMGRVTLDEDTTRQIPLNSWVKWDIQNHILKSEMPLQIYIQSICRTEGMVQKGYDVEPLGEDELISILTKIVDNTEIDQCAAIVVIASPTGWDNSAINLITNYYQRLPFSMNQMVVYLFDMMSGELIYNLNEQRARRYVEILSPFSRDEEVSQAIVAIEKVLREYKSINLKIAKELYPYSIPVLKNAFEKLALKDNYYLKNISGIGLSLIRL